MRTLKWDPMFDPKEETSTTIAWIYFPALPPNFFVKEVVFSLAVVGVNRYKSIWQQEIKQGQVVQQSKWRWIY
ncbi:hypothetical protein H5410_056009 [Solanum commersonii]|uniref:DUF4283 domain-containing protein n=1 Tax=Solanum commersonii TaxID=4109 RepID=A0A9J5WJ37_SOLCO|nr:hypothetical protein H5410_056009 [Solanum commersonii]